jgi:serine/threonine protein kinase
MRKLKFLFSFLFILLIAMAAGLALMVKGQVNRQVIVLHNGKIIPVDRMWESGADLFYENDKETRFVSLADIKTIEKQGMAQAVEGALSKVAGGVHAYWKDLGPVFRDPPLPGIDIDVPPGWVAGLAAVPAVLFVGMRLRRVRLRKKALAKAAAPPKEMVPELPNRTDVVKFFLNLYRRQIGALPEAPAEFSQLAAVASGKNLVYELRVKHSGDWVKRRMTIGPLGEDSGSRSKCYYVIFDQHLVVKIPPKPVTDLEDYLASIKKEGHIVERLAPKECLIPKVSVILSKVQELSPGVEIPAEQLEEKYIAWLRNNPEYLSYLKIKDTFVFFMDLSRYYFLGHILEGLHDLGEPVRAEIASTAELIRFPAKARERYGEENESVVFEIGELYHQCEAETRQLLKSRGQSAAVTPYALQSWFLNYLEKKEIGEIDAGLPPELASAIQSIFKRMFEKFGRSVDGYLGAIRSFAQRLSLEQNRLPISGIIINLLDLLGWLSEKKVAMRDLKPDNILVAGDTQNYPGFLRSADDYSLGFIDVETAVYFGKTEEGRIRQPLLGGTPYYATPSHLFPNTTLAGCFGDAARILHFQDWQAVLVMIFKAVTGDLLFDRTALRFADTKTRVVAAMRQKQPLDSLLEEASRMYWRSAAAEFRTKMRGAEGALRGVDAEIPGPAKSLFLRVLKHDIASISRSVQRLTESQSWFSAPGSREQLLRASSIRISQIVEDLKAKSQTGKAPAESVQAGLRFLKGISALKALAERKAQVASALESKASCRMSAFDILVLMFNSVLKAMYREDWNALTEESASATGASHDELSLATTI